MDSQAPILRGKDACVPFVIGSRIFGTGVYHENAAYFFTNAGYPVAVVLPNRTKDYLKSLGYKSKTDKIDGRGLAQLGVERNLRIWEKPNEHIVELRNLIRYKDTLEQMKTQSSNRLHPEASSRSFGSRTWSIGYQGVEKADKIFKKTDCHHEPAH